MNIKRTAQIITNNVLIQETVRYDIEKLFPTLGKYIKGEENNIFTNVLGETIEISVQQTENETADLLKIVLDGNSHAARILAAEVHRTISLSDINVGNNSIPEDIHLDTDNLGIWIDPIDSTAEYIHGNESNDDDDDIHVTGLRCVTVLIGGYNKDTGVPVIGVVNQPFHQQIGTRWQGKCFWGLSNSELDSSSLQDSTDRTNIVTISKIETKVIKTKLKEAGFTLIEASGAGYKLLTVITGLADAYIVSQGTTFQWDICGPHAILRSIGGGLYDYAKIVEGEKVEMNYKDNVSGDSKMNKYCNKNGLVATKNEEVLLHISNILRK
ncbi:Inositol polyphosphate 1-phosphatase [Carabus blaptoides fortunei]